MFAVNGNRPGPFPAGQTYPQIVAAAEAEDAAALAASSDSKPVDAGVERDATAAALGKREDRVLVQSEL